MVTTLLTSFLFSVVCSAGKVRNDSTNTCQDCPLNTYRSDAMTECMSCGDPKMYRTEAVGSTSKDDCKCKRA